MANPKDVKAMTDMIRKQYSTTIPRDVLNQYLLRAAEQINFGSKRQNGKTPMQFAWVFCIKSGGSLCVPLYYSPSEALF